MIDPELLAMLRCPLDGGQLQVAEEPLVARVNEAIEKGQARDRLDQRVELPIDGGLVSQGSGLLYPVRGGIPTLVADEAIRLPEG